jgi:hypothetical protein
MGEIQPGLPSHRLGRDFVWRDLASLDLHGVSDAFGAHPSGLASIRVIESTILRDRVSILTAIC